MPSRSCEIKLWRNEVASSPPTTTRPRGERSKTAPGISGRPQRSEPARRRGSGEQRTRLVVTLELLVSRVGVGDDACARLHTRLASLPHHRANRDRSVEVPREVEIPHHTGIRTTLRGLELVDDLHRPHLRRTTHGPGRERGAQYVDGV